VPTKEVVQETGRHARFGRRGRFSGFRREVRRESSVIATSEEMVRMPIVGLASRCGHGAYALRRTRPTPVRILSRRSHHFASVVRSARMPWVIKRALIRFK
jgi:hypothetical protein